MTATMVDWDEKWRGSRPEARLFGAAPVASLCAHLDDRPAANGERFPDTALCLADGDGRNGAWLAAQGVRVTAVDLSAEATSQARALDAALGVSVERIQGDVAGTPPIWRMGSSAHFDLVTMFYLHCPSAERGPALNAATEDLAPGGWVLIEGFSDAGLAKPGVLGPKAADLLYRPAALAAWAEASGLVEIRIWEDSVTLDDGLRHSGPAEIVRFSARRPRLTEE